MNEEEIKFFVINTPALWREGSLNSLQATDQGITLTMTSEYAYADAFDPGPVDPRSLDRDKCGIIYILDQTQNAILTYDPGSGLTNRLQCITLADPISIAVSDTDIYIMDRTHPDASNPCTLYCLSRYNHQIRWASRGLPEYRIAVMDSGRLYALDKENKEIHKLCRGKKTSDSPITSLETNEYPDQDITGDSRRHPVDIASDREGNFYILEKGARQILKFDKEGQHIETITIPYEEEATYQTLAIESSDNIYLGIENEGIVQLSKALQYDSQGSYITSIFDSTMPGCRWHRVEMDADIPANTRVELSYLAGDNENNLHLQHDADSAEIKEPLANPGDVLLNNANGRYLRIRLDLYSDEDSRGTPLVKTLKIHFPRITYLRYLPETYQENEKKREFLERFLSLFETFMSRSEEQITNIGKYLDPAAVPEQFIPWLSSWLAIAHDENWPPEKKRRLISLAPELYKTRGTREAMRRIIELYHGGEPLIVEPFQLNCPENTEMNTLLLDLFGNDPYRFTVLVPPRWETPGPGVKNPIELTGIERGTLRHIIDTEKPAKTTGFMQLLAPWFYLDMHTYLGVNTHLAQNDFVLGKTSVIGRDTVIYDNEWAGQLERKARLGIDAILT
jgi:phage tail-like protein